MKMPNFPKGASNKGTCHIELEEDTPLYLHIIKNMAANKASKRGLEYGSATSSKARWIPPPGKSTLKAKHHNKRQVQFIVKPLPRADANSVPEIPDMMNFIGVKVQQLEDLISTLQEVIVKNRVASEKIGSTGDDSGTCFQRLSEKTEKNFLKLYQEQQHLISKCLEVIESSKATLQHSQAKSYVRDADVQAQVPVPVKEVKSARQEEMASVRKEYFKIKGDLEHYKRNLRTSKEETEKYRQQSQRCKAQLTEQADLLKQLALERDRWKIKLTQMSNEKIEVDTQVTYLKSHLERVQSEAVSSVAGNADKENLRQMTLIRMAELEDENEKLKIAKTVLEDQVLVVHTQITHLQNQLERLQQDAKETINKNASTPVITKSVGVQVGEREAQKSPNTSLSTEEKAKESVSVLEQLEKDLDQKKMAIDNLNINLERKELEVNFLGDKLEAMKSEVQNEESKWRSKISGLETSLWSKKSEISSLKRERQQVERNYLSKLDEVERKLSTAMSTNRSLQDYITLLRNTYATVFSDPSISTVPMAFSTFAL